MGVGSTGGGAAVSCGRNFLGIEIDAAYHSAAKKRLGADQQVCEGKLKTGVLPLPEAAAA